MINLSKFFIFIIDITIFIFDILLTFLNRVIMILLLNNKTFLLSFRKTLNLCNRENICILKNVFLLRSHVINSFYHNSFIINMWLSRLLFMVSSIFLSWCGSDHKYVYRIKQKKLVEVKNVAFLAALKCEILWHISHCQMNKLTKNYLRLIAFFDSLLKLYVCKNCLDIS